MILPLALACHTTPVDSGAPADTAPRDDTAAADDTAPPTVTLSGTVQRPTGASPGAALRVGVVAVRFGDGPEVGGTLTSAPVAGDGFVLDLPDGEDGTIQADRPGSLYTLVVFEDGDGNEVFDEHDEIVRGLSMDRWLAWMDGGWRLLDLGLSGTYAPARCLLDTSEPLTWRDGYPVERDWSEGVTVVLSGLPSPLALGVDVRSPGEGQTRVAALPYQVVAATDPTVAPALDDVIAIGAASWTLDAEPAEAATVGSDPDWRYAFYYLLPYVDADGDGAWSTGDSYDGTGPCIDGLPVNLRYNRTVDSYRGWRLLDCYDAQVGWRAVTRDPESGWTSYLDAAQAAALVIDPSACHY